MRSNNSFLTLIASFCLSAVAYNVAQPIEIPVQHLEFDDYEIQPRVETYVFDDYVIQSSAAVIDIQNKHCTTLQMVTVANVPKMKRKDFEPSASERGGSIHKD